MRTEQIDGAKEQKILISMITCTPVLGRIASQWEKGLFRSDFTEIAANICVRYYDRHGRAPMKDIAPLFCEWAERHPNQKKTVDALDSLLQYLSGEYERYSEEANPDYLIDLATNHFRAVRLERTLDNAKALLLNGKLDEAENLALGYNRVELAKNTGVDLLNDEPTVQAVFDERTDETLIEYPGPLGRLFGPIFCRDSFISFCAPYKGTKSIWLLDVAWKALTARKRVAYFQVCDLSQTQVFKRFLCRAAKWPTQPVNGEWPTVVKIPREIISTTAGVSTRYTEKTFSHKLDFKEAWAGCQTTVLDHIKSHNSYFRICTTTGSTITVSGIRDELLTWEREGFIPDVVVIDYADGIAPLNAKLEFRHQVYDTWCRLRALAAERHVMLATATQVKADGFDAPYLTRKHFSEDSRKLGLVTAMIGTLMKDTEKEARLARMNIICRREGECINSRQVYVANCLPFMQPALLSMDYKTKEKPAERNKETSASKT